ncbi:hypothetical protein [Intestinibacter sp.]|uniref:hypothetical protein n=1 Tax=Intestinibacter sp. TaxID=1965304 RepID=UPI003F167348
MLKYVETAVTFAEVPNEVNLCINISNCPCNCKGCHSSYLAKDIGEPLDIIYDGGYIELQTLIDTNEGISCVCFMGGDSEPYTINKLAKYVKDLNLKVAWYSGRQELSKDIQLKNFDYIKLGPYIEEFGPLNCETTNQKMYKVECKGIDKYELVDITYLFRK